MRTNPYYRVRRNGSVSIFPVGTWWYVSFNKQGKRRHNMPRRRMAYPSMPYCAFPSELYTHAIHLPIRRRQIDLFPELKNHTQNPQR